jgi:hypothetical protein
MRKLLTALILAASIQAATISSITCSGQTATINATAHGIAVSQGFSISGTAATFNSTAKTATTNALTFVLPTGTACSGFTSGYTTIQAAKQIINTGSSTNVQNATVTINYVLWFTTSLPTPLTCTTSANPNPPPSTITTCPTSTWSGASAAENAAIVAGSTVEAIGAMAMPSTTSAATLESLIQYQYTAVQSAYAAFLLAGTGFWYNGTAWVNQ